jgi:hypothetical protein
MAKKWYVNLPQDNSKARGRDYPVVVNLSETEAKASEGKFVFIFLKPDGGGNVPVTQLWMGDRAGGLMGRVLTRIADKKAAATIPLSVCGKDRFKVLIGKTFDINAAKDSGLETIETWRKVFLKVGKMRGCPSADWGQVKSEFEKYGVEIDTGGVAKMLAAKPWVTSIPDVMTELDGGAAVSPQTVKIVFIDRIGKKGKKDVTFRLTAAGFPRSRKHVLEIPDGGYTWPDRTKNVFAGSAIYFDELGMLKGFLMLGGQVRPHGGYAHAEGTAARKILFDFSGMAAIDAWVRAGKGFMQVSGEVAVIEDVAQGMAQIEPPQIVVGSRHPYFYNEMDTAHLVSTSIHEIGHTLGMVPKRLPTFDAPVGVDKRHSPNPVWYDNTNGGVGWHCKTGAGGPTYNANTKRNEYTIGTCTMFHQQQSVAKTAFCADCGKVIRRARLTRLGKLHVWK